MRKRLEMESHLRYAIRNAELAVVYQPQVGIRSGRIVAVEALLRWENPVLGAVPPSDFIPLAEETGLINPIREWVSLQACLAATQWPGETDRPVRVAVNVSAIQFRGGGLVAAVSRVLLEVVGRPVRWNLKSPSVSCSRTSPIPARCCTSSSKWACGWPWMTLAKVTRHPRSGSASL